MKKVKDDGGMPYENPKYNGKSYLEILYMAREMENDAIEVALALDQIAPEEDRKKFIEIANDENDHDKIYAEIIEREESKNNIFGNITNVFNEKTIDARGLNVSGWQFKDGELKSQFDNVKKLILANNKKDAKKEIEYLIHNIRECKDQVDDLRKYANDREQFYVSLLNNVEQFGKGNGIR